MQGDTQMNLRLTRRGFLKATGLAVGSAASIQLLGACAQSPAATSAESAGQAASEEPVVIWMSDDWSGQADQFVAYTNYSDSCSTDISVPIDYRPTDWTTLDQQQPIIMASDKYVVDVLDLGQTQVVNYGRQGKLVALDDLLPKEMLEKWLQGPLETGRVDGKLYGLCVWPSWVIGFYNKELYEKAGLDPEQPAKTLGELEQHCEALLKVTDSAYLDTWTDWHWGRVYRQLVWAKDGHCWEGGTADDPDTIKYTFDSPESKAALEWMKHMYQDKLLDQASVTLTQQDIAEKFQRGETGITFNFEGFAAIMEKEGESEVIGKVGAFAFPGDVPGKGVAQAGFEYMTIPATAQDPDGAAKWIACINDPAIIKARAVDQFFNPVYTELYDDPDVKAKLYYWEVIKEIEGRTLPQNYHPSGGEVGDLLLAKIQEVVLGQTEVDAAIQEIQAFADEKANAA
jgi:ABC-type glycerol-3-phosphate transport system substrate-binding protein